jgi:hypothetical protein
MTTQPNTEQPKLPDIRVFVAYNTVFLGARANGADADEAHERGLASAVAVALSTQAAELERVCEWELVESDLDEYDTGCKDTFCWHGNTPPKFCPGCGGRIVIKENKNGK